MARPCIPHAGQQLCWKRSEPNTRTATVRITYNYDRFDGECLQRSPHIASCWRKDGQRLSVVLEFGTIWVKSCISGGYKLSSLTPTTYRIAESKIAHHYSNAPNKLTHTAETLYTFSAHFHAVQLPAKHTLCLFNAVFFNMIAFWSVGQLVGHNQFHHPAICIRGVRTVDTHTHRPTSQPDWIPMLDIFMGNNYCHRISRCFSFSNCLHCARHSLVRAASSCARFFLFLLFVHFLDVPARLGPSLLCLRSFAA